jgi:hypothetical protein
MPLSDSPAELVISMQVTEEAFAVLGLGRKEVPCIGIFHVYFAYNTARFPAFPCHPTMLSHECQWQFTLPSNKYFWLVEICQTGLQWSGRVLRSFPPTLRHLLSTVQNINMKSKLHILFVEITQLQN